MNILIMGPAGSGKGTMASNIVQEYDIVHISTGDMFRSAIANGTPVGLEAKSYMDKGNLVPDDVTDRMVKERISQADCANGFLLDGYPRNLNQAHAIEKMAAEIGKSIDIVINLNVDYNTLVTRITGRRICKTCGAIYHITNKPSKVDGICDIDGGELYQRSDDTEEKLKIRYNEYVEQTEPSIEYFKSKGLVRDIEADRSAGDVMKDVREVLESVK